MTQPFKVATPEDVRGLLDDPVDRSQLILIDCREEDERMSEGWIIQSRSFPARDYHNPQCFRALVLELAGEKDVCGGEEKGKEEETPEGDLRKSRSPSSSSSSLPPVSEQAPPEAQQSDAEKPAEETTAPTTPTKENESTEDAAGSVVVPSSRSSSKPASPPFTVYAVFYCHSSLSRGPRGALNFLAAQEELGLSFPSVLLLEGGWSAFHMFYHRSRPDYFVYPWRVMPSLPLPSPPAAAVKGEGEGMTPFPKAEATS